MFEMQDFDEHERVTWLHDAASGLRAVIALHSTALGPAAGGCRLWEYPSRDAGLIDVLRLSRGMSYKNAMADLPLGGGKAVIFGPVSQEDRAAVFEAFGAAVDALNGAYITAEDVGVSVSDMQLAARKTRFISGLPQTGGSVGGDPSPFTARGVLRGIEAAVAHRFGRQDLQGLKVAVQGVGNVGGHLCRLLAEQGAHLTIADINAERVEQIQDETGADIARLDQILTQPVDVIAPCALGGAITQDLVGALQAKVIAGAANNQLADTAVGTQIAARGITYAPDYVINAGGIIAVAAEYFGDQTHAAVLEKVDAIGSRVTDLIQRAEAAGEPIDSFTDKVARDRLRPASR